MKLKSLVATVAILCAAFHLYANDVVSSAKERTVVIKYTTKIREQKQDQKVYGLLVGDEGSVVASSLAFNKNLKKENIKDLKGHMLGSDEKFKLELGKRDEDTTLVLLKIKGKNKFKGKGVTAKAAQLPAVGRPVYVVAESIDDYGNVPMLLELKIVAHVKKPLEGAVINSSQMTIYVGSAVYNVEGKLVGYLGGKMASRNRMVMRRQVRQSYLPYTLVMPVENMWKLFKEDAKLEEDQGWSGFYNLQFLDKKLREHLGVEASSALLVSLIVPESPAAVAGFKAEDVIVKMDGEPLTIEREREIADWHKTLTKKGKGAEVKMTVLRREGEEMKEVELTLILGEKPDTHQDVDKTKVSALGVEVCEITWDVKLSQMLDENAFGVYVNKIDNGSPAHLGGIKVKNIIYQVGDKEVKSVDELKEAIKELEKKKPQEIRVHIRSGFKRDVLSVSPNWKK